MIVIIHTYTGRLAKVEEDDDHDNRKGPRYQDSHGDRE